MKEMFFFRKRLMDTIMNPARVKKQKCEQVLSCIFCLVSNDNS
jgi:hypothetical protein